MTKPSLLKLAKQFRKEVIKDFGPKCKDYSLGCIVCSVHRIVDNLEELADWIGELDKTKDE